MTTKRCNECGCDKPLPDFRVTRRQSGRTFYHPLCKACYNRRESAKRKMLRRTDPTWAEQERVKARLYRQQNLETYRGYGRAHYLRTKAKRMMALLEQKVGTP